MNFFIAYIVTSLRNFRHSYIHWIHAEKKLRNSLKSCNSRRCLLKVTFLTTSCIISWVHILGFFDGLLSYFLLLLNKVCKSVKLNLKFNFSISFK